MDSAHSQTATEDPAAHPDTHRATHTFGNHTELLDEDDEDTCDTTPLQVTGHEPSTTSVRRYPTRERRPPRRLDDYVTH